jgi:hypothetical protein
VVVGAGSDAGLQERIEKQRAAQARGRRRRFDLAAERRDHCACPPFRIRGFCMGSLVKKRRKKMSKHKYRKRLKANRHKRK